MEVNKKFKDGLKRIFVQTFNVKHIGKELENNFHQKVSLIG